MVLRVLTSIILLVSVLFMPFWVSVILSLLGIIYFRYYFEAALILLISDVLYGVPEPKFFDMVFISSITAIIGIVLTEFIKKKLRFY